MPLKPLVEPERPGGDERATAGYELEECLGFRLGAALSQIQDEETDENSQKNGFQVRFYPWVPLAKEHVIPLTLEWVVTMVEPMEKLTKLYVEQILNYGKTNQDPGTDDESDSDQSD